MVFHHLPASRLAARSLCWRVIAYLKNTYNVGCILALSAAARTGPLQALVSGLVPPEQLGVLMGLRGFCMQIGVFLFAMVAAQLTDRLGFEGVLMLAAGCQLVSYLAIRFGVHEPAPE